MVTAWPVIVPLQRELGLNLFTHRGQRLEVLPGVMRSEGPRMNLVDGQMDVNVVSVLMHHADTLVPRETQGFADAILDRMQ